MDAKLTRADGAYANVFLGMNTAHDRGSYTSSMFRGVTDDATLEAMYTDDGMAQRIVNVYAEELLRAGFVVEGLAQEDELHAEMDRLGMTTKLVDALRWEGLFGGALVVMLVRDGRLLDQPLSTTGRPVVEALRVYDKRDVVREAVYSDPNDPRFGQPSFYRISPPNGMPYFVHESRCLVFSGLPVPENVREQNNGWGLSRLQAIRTELMRFDSGHYWANGLLERAQQAVHKIPELTLILADEGGEEKVKQRVNLVDMSRSVNNTVVIDGEEDYELKSTPLSGVDQIGDRFGLKLAAVSGIPEGVLYGRQQAGLNSTGKAELETWYSRIRQEQRTRLLPQLTRLVSLILGRDAKITFNALNVLSDAEQAEVELNRAKTRQIYTQIQGISALELRKTLAGEGFPLDDVNAIPAGPSNAATKEE